MDDRFDKYLREELDTVANAPISAEMWDKDRAWGKIKGDIVAQPRTVSIKWLYAAASLLLLFMVGSGFYVNHFSNQLALLNSDNERLKGALVARNSVAIKEPYATEKVVTTAEPKAIVRREIVQNTVYVHDTITVVNYIKVPVNESIAVNEKPLMRDSTSSVLQSNLEKKSKLHFVISDDRSQHLEDKRYLFVSQASVTPKEHQSMTESNVAIKISLN